MKILINFWITIGQKLYEIKKIEHHLLFDSPNKKKKKSPTNQNTKKHIYLH